MSTDDARVCVLPHKRDPERPRRAADGLMVCIGHAEGLERNLAEAPAAFSDLDKCLVRSSGGDGPRVKVTDTEETGIRLDHRVVETRAGILASMTGWCRIVIEERRINGPRVVDVGGLATFLVVHAQWIAAQPWVDDLWLELIYDPFGDPAWLQAARSLVQPSKRRTLDLGQPCPESGCTGFLRSSVGTHDDLLPGRVWCDACDAAWTADQWMTLGRHITKMHEDGMRRLIAAVTG